MPASDDSPPSSGAFSDLSDRLAIRHLAHELNALLDGSMRRLRLARRVLEPPPASALEHLDAAEHALQRMTELLERTMRAAHADPSSSHGLAPSRLFARASRLDDAIAETVDALRPRADEAKVVVRTIVERDVAGAPAGPLVAVLHNGLQNAIEACAATCDGPRVVELVAQRQGGTLVVDIVDTGCGTATIASSPRGHGIGLNLSRLIVEELAGTLALTAVPFDRGAVLEVRVPLGRLELRGEVAQNGRPDAPRGAIAS